MRVAFTHGAIPIGDDRGNAGFQLGDNASLELDEMIRFVRQAIAHVWTEAQEIRNTNVAHTESSRPRSRGWGPGADWRRKRSASSAALSDQTR
jgi:hypothetical protein